MFLQRLENRVHNEDVANTPGDENANPRIKNAKTVSQVLTEKISELQTVKPYKTIQRGEPPIHQQPAASSSSTEPQCKRSIIHALARTDADGDCPDAHNQNIPTYNGFHACLNVYKDKSKAYYHMSYSQAPNKSVVNDVMDKLSTIIVTKRMPFAFLVGDHHVYVLITQPKAENPNKYRDIVPFLGPFNIQCVMMSAIYTRYKGSELGEVLVAGGVIAESSVDRALQGEHYKPWLRCLRLMYEALISQLVKKKVIPALAGKTTDNIDILRDMTFSQESRAAAHAELDNDADLANLIANLFTHLEGSDMSDYWNGFLSMTDALMQGCTQSMHATGTSMSALYVP